MNGKPDSYSRRAFLRCAGAAGLALAGMNVPGANGDIRVAVIGLGNKGSSHVGQFGKMKGVRLAALCDVDPERLDKHKQKQTGKTKGPFCSTDPRRILERDDVDAVVIATPNHWHTLLAIWACQAGKDVYVEKPVSHSLWEGRQLVRAAARHDRIVQAGTQYRSDPGLREAAEYIRAGRLGKILWAHVPWYELRPGIGRAEPYTPQGLDYDLYCGPAPLEPLRRPKLHYDWHWFWSTGDGDLGNSGIHAIDVCRMLAGIETLPPRVLGIGGRFGVDDDAETPNTQLTVLDYVGAPVIVENRNLPQKKGAKAMDQLRGLRDGVVLQCEHGFFAGMRGGGNAYDNDGKRIKQFIGDGGAQHAGNFIAAVRSRKTTDLNAPIAQGALSSAICHLGNISYRLGAGAPPAAARALLAGSAPAADILAKIEAHLAANDVRLDQSMLQLGRRLTLDAKGEEITAVDSPDAEKALAKAQALARGQHREPYTFKE